MSSERELVLSRVRAAMAAGAGAGAETPARAYRRTGTLDHEARIQLLRERIGDYRAQVRGVGGGELVEAIEAAFADAGARRVAIPAGVPVAWRPRRLELVEDAGLRHAELDAFDGVLTGATLAIAQTGTIVLSGAPAEGRRALTLIPDLHVCVVEEHQVVETVPEAITQLAHLGRRPITLISGPSATSDIELRRVEGVHGPRTLHVLLLAGEGGAVQLPCPRSTRGRNRHE